MININSKEECNGCYACLNICPKKAIDMIDDEEGFWYPHVNQKKCLDCSLCEKVCPLINNKVKICNDIKGFACKNKDEKDRINSSSGGVFTLIYKYVIRNNGIVFGASFDDEMNVVHSFSNNTEDCSRFRGAKYVQSRIGESYKNARVFLENGKIVLFSGTPCQIAGIKSYLGKSYDNLILVEIACHGVPSTLVFKKYMNYIMNKHNSEIKDICFRNKKYGWKIYNIKIKMKNDIVIRELVNDNIYMKGYLSDIFLRPSCYKCNMKKPSTDADICLADYWGVNKKHQYLDDDKGVSLVLVNTAKGINILNKIYNDLEIIEIDLEHAYKYNPSIIRSAYINNNRKLFFRLIKKNYDFEHCVNRSLSPSIINRIVWKLEKLNIQKSQIK